MWEESGTVNKDFTEKKIMSIKVKVFSPLTLLTLETKLMAGDKNPVFGDSTEFWNILLFY